MFYAFIDGSSRGNPGPAGAGICLCGADRTFRRGVAHYLGEELTNNQAEYGALILLLRDAAAGLHVFKKIDRLVVYSDSELLVKQMRGEFKVKSPNLVKYHIEARKLLAQTPFPVEFKAIPRKENTVADKLANLAVDFRKTT